MIQRYVTCFTDTSIFSTIDYSCLKKQKHTDIYKDNIIAITEAGWWGHGGAGACLKGFKNH